MDENSRNANPQMRQMMALLSVGPALFVGAVSIFFGLLNTLDGDRSAGGILLLAAAVAFGSVANAVARRY